MLVSAGSDGENRDCLISFSIVPVESQQHYEWHMANEQKHTELRETFLRQPNLVVPTDRKRGLINATKIHLPDCAPRHCAEHLIGNLPKQLKTFTYDHTKDFWKLVFSKNEQQFLDDLRSMKGKSVENGVYLEKNKPYSLWADYCFPTMTWNERTNNISEHAVNWIGEEVRKSAPLVICRLVGEKLVVLQQKYRVQDLARLNKVIHTMSFHAIDHIIIIC
jgi:hypothetical protein